MYIDPGAGSLILQVAAAFVLSVLATLGRVRAAARSLVSSLFRRRRRRASGT